jgi:hypothetical protein
MVRPTTLLLVLVGAACADGPAASPVEYARDVQPIWDRWCVGCHPPQTPLLDVEQSPRWLMGGSRFECVRGGERARFVVPGDPAASFLMYKITGENAEQFLGSEEGCDRWMPADWFGEDTPLVEIDPSAVDTIQLWIELGAEFDRPVGG